MIFGPDIVPVFNNFIIKFSPFSGFQLSVVVLKIFELVFMRRH